MPDFYRTQGCHPQKGVLPAPLHHFFPWSCSKIENLQKQLCLLKEKRLPYKRTNKYGVKQVPLPYNPKTIEEPNWLPLIKIENKAVKMHHLIYPIHFPLKPILCDIKRRSSSSPNYRSSWYPTYKRPSFPCSSKLSLITSFAISDASKILLPPRRHFGGFLTSLLITFFNLLARTFSINLYKLPTKLIGLKSMGFSTSPFFSTRTMKVVFRLHTNMLLSWNS